MSVQTVDLADSLEQSMGSSLEVSLVSLESSSILEESVSGWGDREGRGGECEWVG